jgi:predicted nucleic acid-binding protein
LPVPAFGQAAFRKSEGTGQNEAGARTVFLVDTSIWIEVFKKRSRFDLQSVVPFDEIVTCLPVIQEVLQGFDDERAYRTARDAMYSFPIIESPLDRTLFDEAIQLFRLARRGGYTVRSGVDCIIAACAIRRHLAVIHKDRDFDSLACVSSLVSRNIA